MRWRWDQGRLDYFKFENVVSIAKALRDLEGISIDTKVDLLRFPLVENTGLPFAPSHYNVWRNYARVFHCAMLATNVCGRLVITDVCKRLADPKDPFSSDEYLNFVFSRFTLPFPAFDDYDAKAVPTFPFISIIKFLIANYEKGCSLHEVFNYVVGNNCTGTENLEYFRALKPTSRLPLGDEERQVREMLVFMGQSSYVKWFEKRLYIDSVDFDSILKATTPQVAGKRPEDPTEAFLELTMIAHGKLSAKFDILLKDRKGQEFAVSEGGKVFQSHGKIERSPLVRKRFFKMHPKIVCDACSLKPRERYPWTDNILELHHVLPLSATLNVNGTTTVLDDMIPLCPSCHESIHIYYKIKLTEWGVFDFGSKRMAKDVYEMAKGIIGL